MSAAELFGRLNKPWADIHGHLGFFIELCEELDAQTVIECGVRSGVSTSAWLVGLEATGGHLWSVDVDPAPFEADNWTFLQGNDLDPAILAQLPEQADIVFIDTSHTKEHTLAEIDTYLPRVRPGGWMLFHDTDAGEDYGVRPALDERLPGWTNRPGSYGLGMWQV